ncbi:transcriptional regulator, ArgR family [Peptoclostridium litorale DSM 5388]|uniref:Arginine repressor n=1 Tax=Peptoclostridium litorale DSM 5388 TaxID=1121324 RepID=A0A069RAS5_PEPLI|nr:arginine repressor [Peptoclostridium litorale]KDR94116.1 arginine repressor [Peptoclostridium litorale DSM 5388]SIN81071.1 transcriptional regulator, ArgR family [Peptoclostridium litorale DSM 5388]
MKLSRHSQILEIIKDKEIETQDELALELKGVGINVTQATVSRDIKELKLVKVLSPSGKYKYTYLEKDDKKSSDKLIRVAKDTLISMDYSENIICLRTIKGAAPIVAHAVDSLELREIVGTIGGINTVFILLRDRNDVEQIMERFKKLL